MFWQSQNHEMISVRTTIPTHDRIPDFVAVSIISGDQGHHVPDLVALHDGDSARSVREARSGG